jgi:hypothetical protein
MAKQTFTLNDFSGGANGYVDPLDIADNELAACQGFKAEPGTVIVLGDMKGAYTPSAANENIDVESGYGLFAFSHDYTQDGSLGSTKYLAMLSGVSFNTTNISGVTVTGTTYAAVDSNPDTITDSGSGFVAAGFEAGMVITVSGSSEGGNNTTHIVDTVAAGTLTLSSASTLTADGAGDTWTITTWEDNVINLGTVASDASFAGSVKPCFFIADGSLRVSPGNFTLKDNGEQTDEVVAAKTVYGDYHTITTDAGTASGYMTAGDTIVISGQEMIVLRVVDAGGDDTIHVARNMTGTFTSGLPDNQTVYSVLDTRWRGVVRRRNFADLTTGGTFTEWYSTYSHPRPPVLHHADIDYDSVTDHTIWPFLVAWSNEGATPANDGNSAGVVNVGWYEATGNDDATWDGATVSLYITALYDDAKQESQPHKYSSTLTIPAATELAVWIGVEYFDDGGASYRLNKRATGARLYYEDETNDPGILYQLLEIDFEKGVKNAEAEAFSAWVEDDANISAACPTAAGAAHGSRSGANAFIFADPPKAFSYEFNTGYPSSVNTHARYRTAVLANRRLFAANVYQSGKINGDRMISSPVNKFDILPEYGDYIIDVTKGDGDEIIKLEAYADRILQFKKRTLYIVNVGGGLGEEFLESQHRNMGVENPSQTCMTEYGVAWVNSHGVFLYDGQEITDLTLDKLQMTNTSDRPRALNVTESNIPIIGYHPDNKWLVINVASNISTAFEAEAWIHDFKNGSWTYSQEFTADADYKTNMVWTSDNKLVFAAGTNSSDTPDFFQYRDAGTATPAQGELIFKTKDFHLDAPGVKKKLKSVYVTYSANGSTEIQAHVLYQKASGTATVDSEMEEMGGGTTYYTEADGFKTTSNNVYTVELKPSTVVTDALSFQFQLYNEDAAALAGGNFKLHNISFVYRPLGTR